MGRLSEVKSIFALVYDQWMDDEQAYLDWVDFYRRHSDAQSVLELAGGTGNITKHILALTQHMVFSDISEDMVVQAKVKLGDSLDYHVLDMRDFNLNEHFDAVICGADSINFNQNVMELTQTVSQVKKHLKQQGVFIFDVHHPKRAIIYQQTYVETGILQDIPYEYTLSSHDAKLTHHFAWYTSSYPTIEVFEQRIFTKEELLHVFDEKTWELTVENEKGESGFVDGEKWNICAKYKGEV